MRRSSQEPQSLPDREIPGMATDDVRGESARNNVETNLYLTILLTGQTNIHDCVPLTQTYRNRWGDISVFRDSDRLHTTFLSMPDLPKQD